MSDSFEGPAPISSATSDSIAWFRATRRILKPAEANCKANSLPIPSEAPVTTGINGKEAAHGANTKDEPAQDPVPDPNFLSYNLHINIHAP